MKKRQAYTILAVIIILAIIITGAIYFIKMNGLRIYIPVGDNDSLNSTLGNSTGNSIGYCNTDSDCIPNSCCHATGCIAVSNTPRICNLLCTQECAPGSLDCGQGYCGCINHQCGVNWKN